MKLAQGYVPALKLNEHGEAPGKAIRPQVTAVPFTVTCG